MNKEYLGDGVYVEMQNDYYVVLTTEDGIAVSNTIYLEPEVLIAFERWLNPHFPQLFKKAK